MYGMVWYVHGTTCLDACHASVANLVLHEENAFKHGVLPQRLPQGLRTRIPSLILHQVELLHVCVALQGLGQGRNPYIVHVHVD